MKLYTEQEILSLLKTHLPDEDQADSFVALLTPIEVPSDEEIEEALSYRIVEQISFRKGVKWMRDKIKGGNQ